MTRRPEWAALRFHAGAGGRVAGRAFLSSWMLLILAIGMTPPPLVAVLARLAHDLARPDGSRGATVAVCAFAFLACRLTAERTIVGLHGWMRHLPVRAVTHRRAVWGSACAASAGVWIAAALLLAGVLARAEAGSGGLRGDPWRLVGLALAAPAVAACAVPVRGGAARLAVAVAVVCAIWATPLGCVFALVGLVLYDAAAEKCARHRAGACRRWESARCRGASPCGRCAAMCSSGGRSPRCRSRPRTSSRATTTCRCPPCAAVTRRV